MNPLWVSLLATLILQPAHPGELQVAEEELRKAAFQLARDRHYEQAAIKYAELRSVAEQSGNRALEIQAINAIGSCYYGQYQYRQALEYYQQALAKAAAAKDFDLEGIIATNIGSLYASIGESKLAQEFILRYPLDGERIRRESRLHWHLLQVQVFSRNRDWSKFEAAKLHALAEADREAPASLQPSQGSKWPEAVNELRRAWVFDVLSDAYLDLGQIPLAVAYAEEAFRLHATYQDKERLRSLLQLCVLKRKSGSFAEAGKISSAILDLDQYSPTPMQLFRLHRERALSSLASGETQLALNDFRRALEYPRAWRAAVLPSDSAFLHFEQFLNGQVQEEFLEAMLSTPEANWAGSLVTEAFWISEEARFASLRAALFPKDELTKRLGEKYWPLLRRFEALQSKVLAGEHSAVKERDALLHQMQEMELGAGLSFPVGETSPEKLRRQVARDETVFSYYFGKTASLAFALSRAGLQVRKIPAGKDEMEKLASEFGEEVRSGKQDLRSGPGSQLRQLLFGGNPPAGTWTIVVNDPIARTPLAALPAEEGGFLVEHVALRFVPSAIAPAQPGGARSTTLALAFADPIYNAADPRLPKDSQREGFASPVRLNRLPMTAVEAAEATAELSRLGWHTREHLGAEASVANLRKQLEEEPGILHIAAHFGEDAEAPELTSLVLSAATGNGSPQQFFSVKDLTALRTRCSLVVLNGCDSAAGKTYPGIGLAGLSRAWIISGAESVISTLWPVADTSNPLLKNFYRQLRPESMSMAAIAAALQKAQRNTIQENGSFSHPKYWAAYTLLQRN
jgi:CHAT domain-containing protein/tetratricopeptide (TPR) repeat protein